LSIGDLREFQRDDGSVGNVRSVEFSDGTGIVRLSLWDTKADYDFKVGDPYLFENVRTKLGMYAVDLNVGSTSRIRKLTQEEEFMLPSYETIEEMIYTTETIDEIDEDDQNIRVIARIFEVNEPREFNKQDGTTGRLRRIEIADMTGSINLVLWNEDVDIEYGVGDAIKIDNPRIQYNDNENRLELQTGGNTSILTPSVNEIENLPSFEELQELVYQTRTISTIEDGDVNIRIKGIITDPSNNKILLAKCPSCNNSIDEFAEEGETCDYCGAEIDEPKYTLMIPARLKDYDSEDDIAITFFGRLAEDLLDITTKDAVELINDSDDLGVLDGRVDDLEGLNIEIIADVDFDEYSEQTRLKPKKILSKEY
ncbi:MAG: replication protein A, partial [Methanobrevibacter sp.]|nr:replication protein A [Methanobrevibacter sp.]